MSEQRNVLKEAVIKREGESMWLDMVDRAKANPFFERILKEGITSDVANALGRMHDVVVEAAKPALIGREIIKVMLVKDAVVRFPKAKVAYAYKVGEGAEYFLTGEKYETTDVKAETEIKAGCAYTKKFYEMPLGAFSSGKLLRLGGLSECWRLKRSMTTWLRRLKHQLLATETESWNGLRS